MVTTSKPLLLERVRSESTRQQHPIKNIENHEHAITKAKKKGEERIAFPVFSIPFGRIVV
jgi:hypothetical protein